MTKESLGINGEHTELGRQIKDAEFRGYVIASLKTNEDAHAKIFEEIKALHEDLKEQVMIVSKRTEALENRTGKLEEFKNQAVGYMVALGAGASLAVDLLFKVVFK